MTPPVQSPPRPGRGADGGPAPTGRPRGALHRQLAARRSRRRTLVTAVVAGVLLVLAGVVVWLVWGSSVLATERVAIRGADTVTAHRLREVAAVPEGLPLARQDLDAIARRTAAVPQVASVRVERAWPHTLVVTVAERTPQLAVEAGAGYLLVDGDGVAYQAVRAVPKGVLPAQADATDPTMLRDLGQVAAALPPELRAGVRDLAATSPDAITLHLDDDVTVTWGDATQSPLKAQVVLALLDSDPRAIDVSAPHNPAVR